MGIKAIPENRLKRFTEDRKGEGDVETGEMVFSLKIADIKPGRYQPRAGFNKERLNELVSSIKEKGVVQPILVRTTPSGYELIAGERRLRAAKILGMEKIPAITREVDDINAMEIALIENIQREDLNPMEEAAAYQRLHREFGFTQEMIAQAVGKDRSSVTNILRLLNLPVTIQKFIMDELLTMGHARALLTAPGPASQMSICKKVIRRGLSVRETENLVKKLSSVKGASPAKRQDPHEVAVEEDLQRVLGTKVRLQHGKKRGRLIIEYFSPQDLERIIGIIKS